MFISSLYVTYTSFFESCFLECALAEPVKERQDIREIRHNFQDEHAVHKNSVSPWPPHRPPELARAHHVAVLDHILMAEDLYMCRSSRSAFWKSRMGLLNLLKPSKNQKERTRSRMLISNELAFSWMIIVSSSLHRMAAQIANCVFVLPFSPARGPLQWFIGEKSGHGVPHTPNPEGRRIHIVMI